MPDLTKTNGQTKPSEQNTKPDPEVMAILNTDLDLNPPNDKVSVSAKNWAYFISLSAPPLGLLFGIYYYFFNTKNNAKRVALWCVILTALALFGLWFFTKMLLSGSGVNIEQIQQITPEQIQELYN